MNKAIIDLMSKLNMEILGIDAGEMKTKVSQMELEIKSLNEELGTQAR